MNAEQELHRNQPVIRLGDKGNSNNRAVILLHGRGSTAEAMIPFAEEIARKKEYILIPQAALQRWYPKTAFGPLEENEPDLSSALLKISSLINELTSQGVPAEQIAMGGFSQGACLAAEYVARNPKRYRGVFILSGALIGPGGAERTIAGSLAGTPVFIGSSDVDPWIPPGFVEQAANTFESLGASVDLRIYPGLGHIVNQEEIQAVQNLLDR